MPIAALLLLYLLVRRVGWRPLVAFSLALVIPLAGYLNWYHSERGVYAFNQFSGRFLFARTSTFADCDKLDLSARLRVLCPEQPVSARSQRPDEYIWTDVSIARREYADVKYDPYLNEFAMAAITQQPLDYAETVLRETAWAFAPSLFTFDAGQQCLTRAWQLPVEKADFCQTRRYPTLSLHAGPGAAPDKIAQVEKLRPVLKTWSRHSTVPGPVLLLGVLIAFAAALWRPRRANWAVGRDALLFGAIGLGMVVASIATSMHDPRYVMPSLFFIGIGAALGIHRIAAIRGPAQPQPAEPASAEPAGQAS